MVDSDSLNNDAFRGSPLSTYVTAPLNQSPSPGMRRYNGLDDDGMVPRVDIFQTELAPQEEVVEALDVIPISDDEKKFTKSHLSLIGGAVGIVVIRLGVVLGFTLKYPITSPIYIYKSPWKLFG